MHAAVTTSFVMMEESKARLATTVQAAELVALPSEADFHVSTCLQCVAEAQGGLHA